jgi:hypothetical protein
VHDDPFVDQFVDSLEDHLALWVIDGIVAAQDQRAIHLHSSLAERLNDPNGVLPSVEPGDLYDQRTIGRHSMIGKQFWISSSVISRFFAENGSIAGVMKC